MIRQIFNIEEEGMKSRGFLHGILYIESMLTLSTYMLLLQQEKTQPNNATQSLSIQLRYHSLISS